MYLRVLAMELDDIKPEVKFFLAAFVRRFGCTAVVAHTVKDLAKVLGVPDQLVSRATADLVCRGWLESLAVAEGRGRPKSRFVIHAAFAEKLRCVNESSVKCESMIGHLISDPDIQAQLPDNPSGAVKQIQPVAGSGGAPRLQSRGRLSIPGRLLLITLLSRADAFGVVRDVGNAQLRRLTGLDDASLKHRLQRLTSLGFIRSYVGGVSSSIFPAKIKSTYFLNLNHPMLAPLGDAHAVLVHQALHLADSHELHMNIFIENARAAETQPAGYARATPLQVATFFKSWRHLAVFQVLQLKLNAYASYLLSHHWPDLGGRGKRIEVPYLNDWIDRDFRFPQELSISDERMNDKSLRDAAVDYFYGLAFEMADQFKTRFSQVSGIPFGDMDFTILPLPKGYFHLSLLAFPRSVGGWRGSRLIKENGSQIPDVLSSSREACMSLEDRYDCGLLTRPKG